MRLPNWPFGRPTRYHDIPLLPNLTSQSTPPGTPGRNEDTPIASLNTVSNSSSNELDKPASGEGRGTPRQEWTRGVLLCAYGTSFVLLLNTILAAIAASRTYGIYGSQVSEASPIYKGDCSKSKGWAMGLHLVINVLSTVILAATNYCMQCLGAPARADIDKAHAQRRWLEIGTPSFRNLRFFDRRHTILWFLLLVTSLPIHLLYNSAIFSSLASTQYPVFIAPSDTDFNKPLLNTTELECFFYPDDRWKIFECLDLIADGDFDYLTPQQCIDTFAVDYLSGRGALILLSNDLGDSNNTVLWAGFSDSGASYEPFGWMCESGEKDCDRDIDPENWSVWGAPWKYPALDVHFPGINHTTDSMRTDDLWKPEYCKSDFHTDLCLDINTLYLSLPYYLDKDELNDVLRDPDKWLNMSWAEEVTASYRLSCAVMSVSNQRAYPLGTNVPIEGCVSQKIQGDCQLLFSLPICLAVLGCNLIKVICMFLTAHDKRSEKLLTVGDAISTFLFTPDLTTKGRCLMSKSSVSSKPNPWKRGVTALSGFRSSYGCPDSECSFPKILPPPKRWFHATSLFHWVVTIALGASCLIGSGYLFRSGARSVVARGSRADLKSLWDLGIGSPASATLIEVGSANVMLMVLLANSPQLIVSVTYFLYNSLLTRMLLAAEYNDYATHRKPLRVSWPKGGQRSTYYLSLPYKFSLPLMAVAALLHWLISQSIFYVQVISIEFDGYINDVQFISACGYSPMGIIFAIIVGGLLLLTGPALGMKRLTSRMPLAGNCSAAISAVCHPPPDDKDAALKPVMWGEIVTEPTLNSTSTEADDAMVRPRGWNKLTATDDDTEYKPGPQIRAERAGSGISSDEYPHCSFTSQEVIPPNPIRLYT